MTAARLSGDEFGGPRMAPPVNFLPPPPPPPPPLYPQCMRHQHHRCFYNRPQNGCRSQQQPPPPPLQHQPPPCSGPEPGLSHHHHLHNHPPPHHSQQKQKDLLVLKVVSSADAEPDKKAKFEIVGENVRHGRFRKAVPCMPLPLSVLLCLVNMLAPGVGTFVAGLTVLCGCPTEYDDRCTAFCYNILASALQALTALIVVGWVWSIMWGITFVSISITRKEGEIIAASL